MQRTIACERKAAEQNGFAEAAPFRPKGAIKNLQLAARGLLHPRAYC